MENDVIVQKCRILLDAYSSGELGQTIMPEDTNPGFSDKESNLCYFTLPMSLNYQRNSYKLWGSALKTFEDKKTRKVFNISNSAEMKTEELRNCLLKHKLALQPNKHVNTWQRISRTIKETWGSMMNLLEASEYDFLKLKEIIQGSYKKGFPYLSGPKIFNYWSSILQRYCSVDLKNDEFIEIALDTHVMKCSVLLGVITEEESKTLSKEAIYKKWREALRNSNICPADLHSPLWFWSKNGFLIEV